jgi:serine/threonine protein kinase
MNAYRELYELEIVHRDLKLANIFIKKGVLKLADFGFAIRS